MSKYLGKIQLKFKVFIRKVLVKLMNEEWLPFPRNDSPPTKKNVTINHEGSSLSFSSVAKRSIRKLILPATQKVFEKMSSLLLSNPLTVCQYRYVVFLTPTFLYFRLTRYVLQICHRYLFHYLPFSVFVEPDPQSTFIIIYESIYATQLGTQVKTFFLSVKKLPFCLCHCDHISISISLCPCRVGRIIIL